MNKLSSSEHYHRMNEIEQRLRNNEILSKEDERYYREHPYYQVLTYKLNRTWGGYTRVMLPKGCKILSFDNIVQPDERNHDDDYRLYVYGSKQVPLEERIFLVLCTINNDYVLSHNTIPPEQVVYIGNFCDSKELNYEKKMVNQLVHGDGDEDYGKSDIEDYTYHLFEVLPANS